MEKIEIPKSKKNAKLVLLATLVFAAIDSVLMLIYYEPDVHFFKYGAVLPTVFMYLTFILSAALLFDGLFDRSADKFKGSYNRNSQLATFGSAFSGFILIAEGINELLGYFNPDEEKMISDMVAKSSENAAPFDLTIPIAILSFASAVFFILQPFRKKIRPVGLVFVVRMILYIINGYFSKETPLNSPVRILDQMCLILIMLYFIYEMRFVAGEDRPRYYLAFAPLAIFLTGISSVSELVCTVKGILDFNTYTYNAVLKLALLIYMISKYIVYINSNKKEKADAGTESDKEADTTATEKE